MLSGKKTSRLIFWIALGMMVTIAVIIPLAFFYISYTHQAVSLESEARFNANVITGIISTNPEMWELEQMRLQEILSQRIDKRYTETWRILNLKNEVVAESAIDLGFPVMERRFDLLDSGVVAGTITVQRSLLPLLTQTALIGTASMSLSMVVFMFIRIIPIRALERKEEALRRSDEKFLSLVTTIEKHHFIYQHNKERAFTYLSPSITTILGYLPEEFMMHYLTYLTDHPANKLAKEFTEICLSGKSQLPFEREIYHKDGRRIWLEVVELPIVDDNGNVTGLQGVAQDISERKKTQEMHLMNAQLEAMRKLIRGLSHEIRNPLFGISSVSQVLQREMEDEKYLPMVKALNTESNRIANLIEELNMYATPKNPVISHIDARSFIDKLLLKFPEKYPDVNFKVNIEPSITIKGDESLLAYAIEQLIENSCQAEAAKINIDIYPDVFLYGEQVNFSIRDNGKGINEKEMLKCFEPFYTTKRGSTGLGLSLSKRIIEIHGGRFNISSGVGEGTSISFSI